MISKTALDLRKKLAGNMVSRYHETYRENSLDIKELVTWKELYEGILKIPSMTKLYWCLHNFTFLIAGAIQGKYISSTKKMVKEIRNYMEKHYMENITLGEISQEVSVSEKYICKIIKNETDKTFKELLGEIRIEKAVQLIKDTNLKNYEIAERVGFKDARYFGQLFKKIVGVTPREFKTNGMLIK